MKLTEILTKEQLGLIVGALLGDASIPRKLKGKGNHYIDITHSEKQLDYLNYKIKLFKEHGFKVSSIYKRKVKTYTVYSVHIYYENCPMVLNTLRWWFYHTGKKYFTYNMIKKLTPLGMAIWFMDDGSRVIHYNKEHTKIKGRELYISTYMSREEHSSLIHYLSKFDIVCKEVRDRLRYRLRMNATNSKKFIPIIKPYICPSMLYKVDLQYK